MNIFVDYYSGILATYAAYATDVVRRFSSSKIQYTSIDHGWYIVGIKLNIFWLMQYEIRHGIFIDGLIKCICFHMY